MFHPHHAHAMPWPQGAPERIRAKVADGRLPLETPARVWAENGSLGKKSDGCDEPIVPSQILCELSFADGRTVHLHLGCASLLEAERRRRVGP
jgi:hypothetical protein